MASSLSTSAACTLNSFAVDVVVGLRVAPAREHAKQAGHLKEREERRDPRRNGERRVRPRNQESERGQSPPSSPKSL
jgi:hypothetical protein